MNEGRRKLINDVLYSYLPKIASIFTNLLYVPLLTKFIGEAQYGIWTQMFVSFTLFFDFIILNQNTSIRRFLAGKSEKVIVDDLHSSIIVSVLLALLFAIIVYIFEYQVSMLLFGTTGYKKIVYLIPIILLIKVIFTVSISVLKAQRHVRLWSGLMSLRTIVESIFSVLVVFTFRNIYFLILSYVFVHFLFSTLVYGSVIRIYGFEYPSFRNTKKYIFFGIPLLIPNISHSIVTYSDRIFLANWTNLTIVGIYAILYGMANIISTISTPINDVLLSDLSSLVDKGDIREWTYRVKRTLYYLIIVLIPATIGLILVSESLIRFISTNLAAESSSAIIPISIGMGFYGLLKILVQSHNSRYNPRYVALTWAIIALFNLGLNILLIPRFKIYGAAVSTLLAYFAGLVIITWKLRAIMTIRIDPVLRVFISNIVMTSWILTTKSLLVFSDQMTLVVIIPSSILIYLTSLVITGAVSKDTIRDI